MALSLATFVVFVLAFSLLWTKEQKRYNRVDAKISEMFNKSLFPEQKANERDRSFSLFPFEPAPLLFKKLRASETLLSRPSLYVSAKLLWSLLIAGVFGLVIGLVSVRSQNLYHVDIPMLEIALFGLAFFLTRDPDGEPASEPTDTPAGQAISRIFSGFGIFFVTFAILVPLLLWLMNLAALSMVRSPYVFGTPGNAGVVEAAPGNADELLIWTVQFLLVVALFLPVFLFLFDIGEAKLRIEEDIYAKQNVSLGAMTRIRNIVAPLGSVVCSLVVLKVNLSSLSLFSGLVAAGLSVAMRESITNFFSGLQMAWDGSLKKGDVISIPQGISNDTGSTYGIVKAIRSRYTVIEDRNTVRRLVPNFLMVSQPIEHWTHEDDSVRLSLRIGIPYVKKPDQVRQAQRIMESVCYDVPRVLTEKPPNALLVRYDDSQLTFSLRFWIRDAQNGIRPVISEVLISLYERLCDAGIRIPFPQQDIHIKELPQDCGNLTVSLDRSVSTEAREGADA